MTIKKLFDGATAKVEASRTRDDIDKTLSSKNFPNAKAEDRERFVPRVDFSDFSNWVRFGSAEQYVQDSFFRIYDSYPFDGSKTEKQIWHNSSSFFDKYVFDNVYPRTTGYAVFCPGAWGSLTSSGSFNGDSISGSDNPEYILLKGGPGTGSSSEYKTSNVYDTGTNRTTNLKIGNVDGNTIEWWMKKSSFATASNEIIFSMRDNADRSLTILANSESDSYGAISVVASSASWIEETVVLTQLHVSAAFDGEWHQYALSFSSASSGAEYAYDFELNFDNVLAASATMTMNTFEPFDSPILATLGGWVGGYLGSVQFPTGSGKFSGSLDEFRFWKRKRTKEELGRNWFTTIDGGSNTDDYATDLGIYYKFNEGVFDSSSISSRDKIVLDYSGRLTHGYWVGYSLGSRSTGSAIDESSASIEFKEPILYFEHPGVTAKLAELVDSASEHDLMNSTNLFNSMPSWLAEEDVEDKTLLKLTQIMGSYFDTLQMQIEELNQIKLKKYTPDSLKPLPFADRLLSSKGLITPEIFTEATLLESLTSRDEERLFVDKVEDTKNRIYENIHNNLTYILKSKGTEKAFRNLIRCYGIDEELIKMNLYANDTEFTLSQTTRPTTRKVRVLTLDNSSSFGATVLQTRDSSVEGSLDHITGSDTNAFDYTPFTLESEIIFPRREAVDNDFFFSYPYYSSSLFGIKEVSGSEHLFKVYSVRDSLNSKDAYFRLTSSMLQCDITSSVFNNLYEDSRWNIAAKLYSSRQDVGDTAGSPPYIIDFYGVSHTGDVRTNYFHISASVAYSQGSSALNSNKQVYAAAERTDLTGTLQNASDIKVSDVKFFLAKLTDEEVDAHNRDPLNYGVLNPAQEIINSSNVPRGNSLALHWNFNSGSLSSMTIGSVSSYGALIKDVSSGALGRIFTKTTEQIVDTHHPATAFLFPNAEVPAFDTDYALAYREQLPETLGSEDMISISSEAQEKIHTKTASPVKYFWAFEKSLSQSISEEMMHFFASVVDFNNLIGEPVNRYRIEYKDLKHLRQLFFQRVRNTPSAEKFISYYKWIDSSIGEFLKQLVPATANMSDGVRNVIESHVLERNKYWTKYPTLEMRQPDPIGRAKGLRELRYNWRSGSYEAAQGVNDRWWKDRAERTNPLLTSGDSGIDANKEIIRRIAVTEVSGNDYYERNFTRLQQESAVKASNPESKFDVPINSAGNKKINESVFQFADSNDSSPSTFDSIVSGTNKNIIGNYQKDYHIVQAHGKTNNNSFLKQGGALARTTLPAPFNRNYLVEEERAAIHQTSDFDTGWFKSNLTVTADAATAWDGQAIADLITENSSSTSQGHYISEVFAATTANTVKLSLDVKAINREWVKLTAYDTAIYSYFNVASGGAVGSGQNIISSKIEDLGSSWYRCTLYYSYTSGFTGGKIYAALADLGGYYPGQGYDCFYFYNLNHVFVENVNIEGHYSDYLVPSRPKRNHSFVTRFSAPGDEKTLTKLRLDPTSEEISPYNAAPFRNLEARENFYENLRASVVSGGLASEGTASIHHVNKNTKKLYRDGTIKEQNDTGFVIHQIPRSSLNYSWIKQSTVFPSDGDLFTGLYDLDVSGASNLHFDTSSFLRNLSGSALTLDGSNLLISYGVWSTGSHSLFGFSSWEQTRVGEEPLSRWQRKENIITVQDPPFVKEVITSDGSVYRYKHQPETHKTYYEPAVSWNSPTLVNLRDPFGNSFALRTTHEGESEKFTNAGLVDALGLQKGETKAYNKIRDMFAGPDAEFKLLTLKTSEIVYPKHQNATFDFIRSRRAFDDSGENNKKPSDRRVVWRDSAADRIVLNGTNSLGYTIATSSIFPLDDGTGLSTLGELNIISKEQYKEFLKSSGSASASLQLVYNTFYSSSNLREISIKFNLNDYLGFGRGYDSYEDFSSNIKAVRKNYSILPEFRISEHMDYYVNEKGGDFLAKNRALLSLPGAVVSSSADADRANFNEEFFKIYSHSDFMKQFSTVDFDAGTDKDKFISLQCKTVKKLLPYNGFYPLERSIQLGGLFSSSYAPYCSGDPEINNSGAMVQALMQPFYAPGIMYNTLKSGIACDWVYYTGSQINRNWFPSAYLSGTMSEFSKNRIPFEALINPNNGLILNASGEDSGRMYLLAPDGEEQFIPFDTGSRLSLATPTDYAFAGDYLTVSSSYILAPSKSIDQVYVYDYDFNVVGELASHLTGALDTSPTVKFGSSIAFSEENIFVSDSRRVYCFTPDFTHVFTIDSASSGYYPWCVTASGSYFAFSQYNTLYIRFVKIYKKQSSNSWSEEQTISRPLGYDVFGNNILLAKERLFVGIEETEDESGFIRVYKKSSGGVFSLEDELIPNYVSGSEHSYTGYNMKYDYIHDEFLFSNPRDRTILSKPHWNSPTTVYGFGNLYAFKYSSDLGVGWYKKQEILPLDITDADLRTTNNPQYGMNFDIKGQYLVSCAPGVSNASGSSYITPAYEPGGILFFFKRSGDEWKYCGRKGPAFRDYSQNGGGIAEIERRFALFNSSSDDYNLFIRDVAGDGGTYDGEIYNLNTNEIFQRAQPYFNWTGKSKLNFSLASNNYFSSIVKFFLPDGKIVSSVSAPADKYKVVKSGSFYCMDVTVKQTGEDNFTYHHSNNILSGSGFGPSYFAFFEHDIDVVTSSFIYEDRHSIISKAPLAPPYLFGPEKARIIFNPSESKRYTLDEIISNSSVVNINTSLELSFEERNRDINAYKRKLVDAINSDFLQDVTLGEIAGFTIYLEGGELKASSKDLGSGLSVHRFTGSGYIGSIERSDFVIDSSSTGHAGSFSVTNFFESLNLSYGSNTYSNLETCSVDFFDENYDKVYSFISTGTLTSLVGWVHPCNLQIYTPDGLGSVSSKVVKETFTKCNKDTFFSVLMKVKEETYGVSPAYKSRQTLMSSFNLFGKLDGAEVVFGALEEVPTTITKASSNGRSRWSISPKMESPVLKVVSSSFSSGEQLASFATYSSVPNEFDGIFFSVDDVAPSIRSEVQISMPKSVIFNTSSNETIQVGSLLDVCGFKLETKKLGQIASSKKIKEAVVAIPFLDQPRSSSPKTVAVDSRHFFAINRQMYNSPKDGSSIAKMKKAVKDYVLPPRYDFLNQDSVPPFIMYIFEFEHILDQEDLAHIWQGVMPKIARRFELDEEKIHHEISPDEFFGGSSPPEDTRWMVFKMKQKAEKSYWKMTADSQDDDRFQFDFQIGRKEPEYSYNWPYDFFSLIESAQFEVGLEAREKTLVANSEKSEPVQKVEPDSEPDTEELPDSPEFFGFRRGAK